MADVKRTDGKGILRWKDGTAIDSELFDQDATGKSADAVEAGKFDDVLAGVSAMLDANTEALNAQVLADSDRHSEN